MENDIKSMPSWFWYVAAAVAAYGIYAYLKAKSAASSSVASEISGVSASTGTAPASASTGTAPVDLSGLTSSVNALPGFIASGLAQSVAGLGAGMTQLESDIKSYMAQQTASIQSGMGAMANQINTGFASDLSSMAGLSKLITTENTSISSLSTKISAVTANEAQIAGMSAYNVIKDILGGLNTTNNAIAKALPSCVSGSGNSAATDYGCLGAAILSGKTSVAAITGGK